MKVPVRRSLFAVGGPIIYTVGFVHGPQIYALTTVHNKVYISDKWIRIIIKKNHDNDSIQFC
jgi:hypothetical protein